MMFPMNNVVLSLVVKFKIVPRIAANSPDKITLVILFTLSLLLKILLLVKFTTEYQHSVINYLTISNLPPCSFL
jgi:hypothetical protein